MESTVFLTIAWLTFVSSLTDGHNYLDITPELINELCTSNGTVCFYDPDHCSMFPGNVSCTKIIALTNYCFGNNLLERNLGNSTAGNTSMGVFLVGTFNQTHRGRQTVGVALTPVEIGSKQRRTRKFYLFKCTLDNHLDNVTKIIKTIGRLDYKKETEDQSLLDYAVESSWNDTGYFACSLQYSQQDLRNRFHSIYNDNLIKVILVNVTLEETSDGN